MVISKVIFWMYDPPNLILGLNIRCFVPILGYFLEKKTLPEQLYFRTNLRAFTTLFWKRSINKFVF